MNEDLDATATVTDPVRLYLDRIGRVALLTAEQEVDLAKRIEAGLYAQHKLAEGIPMKAAERAELTWVAADGATARDHLLEANLRLVVSVAKRYARSAMPLLEIVQEGNLGLVRAVEKFDYRRGFKFSTYATWWIRQAITRALADQSRTIRLPVHTVEKVNRIARARRELRTGTDREPTPAEIAEAVGLTPAQVEEFDRIARDPVSLDLTVGDDDNSRFGDFVQDTSAPSPFDVVAAQHLRQGLHDLLGRLPQRDAEILEWRFGLHDGTVHTHAQIGARFGLSRERIRQLEREALVALRADRSAESLRELAA